MINYVQISKFNYLFYHPYIPSLVDISLSFVLIRSIDTLLLTQLPLVVYNKVSSTCFCSGALVIFMPSACPINLLATTFVVCGLRVSFLEAKRYVRCVIWPYN